MKKLFLSLIATITLSSLSFGQATFDPEANRKKILERKNEEQKEKELNEAKNEANKAKLLAKLPKPYYVKVLNDNYENSWEVIGNNPPKNNLMINKKALQNIDTKLKEYIEKFIANYEKTFLTENDKIDQVELAKKYYLGVSVFKNLKDTIAIEYLKLSDISEAESFQLIANKYIKPDYYLDVYESIYKSNTNLLKDENPEIVVINTRRVDHYKNDEKYYAYGNGKKIFLAV